ncbi:amidohydrolase [Tropicimonas sp. IMCC34043]|uniref:amidohydrolase n=1 Tax=Tropicimonas sp. IMCC34043 TaxID=2248760 RepID=UPI000E261EF2|nr:amidohydrolase [Tropicimonas sp. IMCC34043]
MPNHAFAPTPEDLAAGIRLRHALHRAPELSGAEQATAATIADAMRAAGADTVLTGLGGHGVAAIFEGGAPGPAVMLRAELDALPIREETGVDHRSQVAGRGHLCGHDGHMAILCTVARVLGRARPPRGRTILLFQPAEEDGTGAQAVLADPRTGTLAPDLILALHNLPGLDLGHVALAEGRVACASRGMRIALAGRAAHASQPETGVSPRHALARLMEALPQLSSKRPFPHKDFKLVTIAHVSMGARAFGISPGEGEIWATLRSLEDQAMDELVAEAEALARTEAAENGLDVRIDYHEVFAASHNDPAAVAVLRHALDAGGIPHSPEGQPWRPSEDFGLLGRLAPSAMLFLGSGVQQPPLHDPQFDFPDALVDIGARIFLGTLVQELREA